MAASNNLASERIYLLRRLVIIRSQSMLWWRRRKEDNNCDGITDESHHNYFARPTGYIIWRRMPDNDIDPSLKSLIGMGELVKIYRPRQSSMLSEVLSSLFFVVLGLSAVYYAWLRYLESHRINGETILFIIVVV